MEMAAAISGRVRRLKWHELGPFTIFDLETTGLIPIRDRIVEIGAVRIEQDGTWSRFTTLVNPGIAIPVRAQSVHGISDEMVAGAPSFKDAAYQFLSFYSVYFIPKWL